MNICPLTGYGTNCMKDDSYCEPLCNHSVVHAHKDTCKDDCSAMGKPCACVDVDSEAGVLAVQRRQFMESVVLCVDNNS